MYTKLKSTGGLPSTEANSHLDELDILFEGLQQLFTSIPQISRDAENTVQFVKDGEGMTHEGLVNFRGKVSRMINRIYPVVDNLRKSLTTLSESGSISKACQERYAEEYGRRLDLLSRYKSELSCWWTSVEGHIYKQKRANFLQDIEIAEKQKKTGDPNDPLISDMLRSTRQKLTVEVDRMQKTASKLSNSSRRLDALSSIYSEYGDKLRNSGTILRHLRRRAEADSRYIWAAFLLLVFMSAFVVLKRTATLRTLFRCARLILYALIYFFKSTTLNVLGSFAAAS